MPKASMTKTRRFSRWLSFALTGAVGMCGPLSAAAHDLNPADRESLKALLPTIQAIEAAGLGMQQTFRIGQPPDPVTLDVLEDYDALIAFMLGRKMGPRAHFIRPRTTMVLDVPAYKLGLRRLPDNLNIFLPNTGYGQSVCGIDCRKLILEGYVKSVTYITPIRPSQKFIGSAQTPKEKAKTKNSALSHDKATDDKVTQIATRFSRGACPKPDPTAPIFNGSTSKSAWQQQSPELINFTGFADLPLLDLCVTGEEVEVPETGFYYNQTSPLWPDELTPKPGQNQIFSELDTLDVRYLNGHHWSNNNFSAVKGQPAIRFEYACLSVKPLLSDISVQLIVNRRKAANAYARKFNQNAPEIMVTQRQKSLCYGQERPDKMILGVGNFFSRSDRYGQILDIRNIYTPDEIAEKINHFVLDPDATQGVNSSHEFENTLWHLERNHPDFTDHIFPKTLPKLIGVLKQKPLRSAPRIAAFPEGSLANYIGDVEEMMNQILKDCEGWKCEDTPAAKSNENAAVSLLSATGAAGLSLLEKAEAVGLPNIDNTALCMEALTEAQTERFLSDYKTKIRQTISVLTIDGFPMPKTAPKSEKVGRLLAQIYTNQSPKYLTKYTRGRSGLNLQSGYNFQEDAIVFYKDIDPEIMAFLEENELMDYLEVILQRDYSSASALRFSNHAYEVKAYLEGRLETLNSLSDNTTKDKTPLSDKLSKMKDRLIIGNQSVQALATKAGQREKEIMDITQILKGWDSTSKGREKSTNVCPARAPQFNFF